MEAKGDGRFARETETVPALRPCARTKGARHALGVFRERELHHLVHGRDVGVARQLIDRLALGQHVEALARLLLARDLAAEFVDGVWVGRAEAGDRAWWTPSPGRHELVVMTPTGERASRWLEVRQAGGGL